MLIGVRLENFKCFEKLEIKDLGNLTIITGKNNVGKSAIIQAINLIKESILQRNIAWSYVNLRSFKDTVYKHDVGRNIVISCKFKLSKGNRAFLGSLFSPADFFEYIEYIIEIKNDNKISELLRTNDGKVILSVMYDPVIVTFHKMDFTKEKNMELRWSGAGSYPFGIQFREEEIRSLRGINFIDQLYKMIKNFFLNIFYISPSREINEWKAELSTRPEEVGIDGNKTSSLLHYVFSDRDEKFNEVEKWLTKFDPEIKVLKSPLESGQAEIALETKVTDINIIMTGTGLKTVLPLVVQSIVSPMDSTIMVEEPEIHLHRGAQKTLIDLLLELTDKDKQIIFTTHSWDIHIELYKLVKNKTITEDRITRYDITIKNGKRIVQETNIFDENFRKYANDLKMLLE